MTNILNEKKRGVDLSGLEKFDVSSLIANSPKNHGIGDGERVAYASVENFQEDSDNARKKFDDTAIHDLALSMQQINPETGKPRGILEPISVKHHPDKPGCFIINGGNRRYRAARLAGLKEIPYIVKDHLTAFDKFVLNDQRENLNPLEVATFIKERLEEGYKSGEIAQLLGRTPSYVSDHSIFFDMAPCIRRLYDDGLCTSMQALGLLHRAYKKNPEEVEIYCERAKQENQELSTAHVRKFTNQIKSPANVFPKEDVPSPTSQMETSPRDVEASGSEYVEKISDDQHVPQSLSEDLSPSLQNTALPPLPSQTDQHPKDSHLKKVVLEVRYKGRDARLLYKRRSASPDLAWIKYDDGKEIEASIRRIQLVSITESS